ncbi:MAG TPA: hypothetical protein VLA60_10520 [Nitrospirales bacterium]|nr:hypothetical protein [Nitrospirales bacterium]
MMKSILQQRTNSSANNSATTHRKIRRRHTRIHLDSLRPDPSAYCADALAQCPKCQGLVHQEGGETSNETVVRCLNCGWQPHYQTPIIRETAESRLIRSLTAQFVSEYEWHRVP